MNKFKYVGHPLVDVGVSVMEILSNKLCDEFTDKDIEDTNNKLIKIYDRKIMKGFLSTIFPNSAWANFSIKKEKKDENIKSLLYETNIISEKCFYCQQTANRYANRQDIPLLTGMGIINIMSHGKGVPVCRFCLASIQFFPLATIKVSGKSLFWHTHNDELTYQLCLEYFNHLQKLLVGSTDDKIENFSYPYTRLFESLQNTLDNIRANNPDKIPITDCIGYHITNYGTSPSYKEYIIPAKVLLFFKKIKENKALDSTHKGIIQENWIIGKKDKNKPADYQVLGNDYYNAWGKYLQDDFGNSIKYVIPYFLMIKKRELISFDLVRLFLIEVAQMDKSRLDKIEKIADKIVALKDERLIKELYLKKYNSAKFLDYLVRVQNKLKNSSIGCFSLGDVCAVLNISSLEDSTSYDYWLARDLMLIRMIEKSEIKLDDKDLE